MANTSFAVPESGKEAQVKSAAEEAPVRSALNAMPIHHHLDYYYVEGWLPKAWWGIHTNPYANNQKEFYIERLRNFRTHGISDDQTNPQNGTCQYLGYPYMYQNPPDAPYAYNGTRDMIDTQDATTLAPSSPSMDGGFWAVMPPSVTSNSYYTQHWGDGSVTLQGIVNPNSYLPQPGELSNSVTMDWSWWDGYSVDPNTGGPLYTPNTRTCSEGVSDEYFGHWSNLVRVLNYLWQQDFVSLWNGTPSGPYGALLWNMVCGTFNGIWICKRPTDPGPVSLYIPGSDWASWQNGIDLAAWQQMFANNSILPFDNQIYPGNLPNNYGQTGNPGMGSRDPFTPWNNLEINYGTPYSGGNMSMLMASRAEVRPTDRLEYTVYEKVLTVNQDAQNGGVGRVFVRQVSTGVLLPGQKLALPAPSITTLPFISDNVGGTGQWVVADRVQVGIIPDISLSEYVSHFNGGTGVAGPYMWLVNSF